VKISGQILVFSRVLMEQLFLHALFGSNIFQNYGIPASKFDSLIQANGMKGTIKQSNS